MEFDVIGYGKTYLFYIIIVRLLSVYRLGNSRKYLYVIDSFWIVVRYKSVLCIEMSGGVCEKRVSNWDWENFKIKNENW